VARPPAGRSDADEPVESAAETDSAEPRRTSQSEAFWSKVKIDPVEIALPDGAGYTLRAYRMDSEITPSDYTARDDVEFPDRASGLVDDIDDLDFDVEDEDDELDPDDDDADVDEDEDTDEDDTEDEDDEESADADEADEHADEEVPLFLSAGGHLLLFRSAEGLVEFVQSDAEHDLAQLDTWSRFTAEVRAAYIVPDDEDTYELDLVVKNLRGGHDTWDPDLLVKAGQVARDLGHALRIDKVVLALAPGSPLDDLDEALRGLASGGLGTFFARRKAKKIGTETASLSWRSIIGKISAVVDWRD
jgi:hypothetical protein